MGLKIDSNIKVVMNQREINRILSAPQLALMKTAEAVRTDLLSTQTMPFASGTLQNEQTQLETTSVTNGVASVVSDTPYARRLYFHPEYNFQTGKNANAGGRWFDPYINGELVKWVQESFANFLRRGQ